MNEFAPERVDTPYVDVAMATYNGSAYVLEQIKSIEEQSFKEIKVHVSDDKSSDDTVTILSEREIVSYVEVNDVNLGPSQNFWKALSLCKSDYVAFCDQDDTWRSDKIELLMERILLIENEKGKLHPILVYSDLTLVDRDHKLLSNSFFGTTGKTAGCSDPRDFIVSNHIPGCTMLMNRALIDRAGTLPLDVRMHDWWIAMIASLTGTMSYVDAALINYRQHDNNAVGAPPIGNRSRARSISRYFEYAKKRAAISNSIVAGIRALAADSALRVDNLPRWVRTGFTPADRLHIATNPKSGESRLLSTIVACLLK
jgi:glycosyltransferase involved in cell wall biosynthesis